jgi:transcriptional regulator with XRE-family HTH domain
MNQKELTDQRQQAYRDKMVEIGQRIKEERAKRGLNVLEMTCDMDVSPKYLYRVERGENVTIETFFKVYQYLFPDKFNEL